jgi:saccharopine dehydrogenase (NAD+, L-lysine-forming)
MDASLRGAGRTLLLLGGYGRAGLRTAELLLDETDARLILAGRDESRAQETARGLNQGRPDERVAGMRVDATDVSSLGAAFSRCDLVTVCTPLTGIGPQVVDAALDAGIDYLGINVEPVRRPEIEALSRRVKQAGLRFVTDAGLVPGVPAALARWSAPRFDHVEEVTVGMLINESDLTPGSAVDLIAASGVRPTVYERGEWRRASLTMTRKLDFGATFGARTCYPMDVPELKPLPDQLHLERAGAYVAGVNGWFDAVATVWLLLGLGRSAGGAKLGARLLVQASRRSRPPFGTVLAVETLGEAAGQRQRFRVAFEHADGWIATAIPTVCGLLQLLDGTLEPGIQMMGHAVEVDRFMGDMERLGMKPAVTTEAPQ